MHWVRDREGRTHSSRFWCTICATIALLYLTQQLSYGFGPRSGNPTPVFDLIGLFIALLAFVLSASAGATVFVALVLHYRQQSSLVAALLGAFVGLYVSGSWTVELLAVKDVAESVVFFRWLLFLAIPTVVIGLGVWSIGWTFENRSEVLRKQRSR